MRDYMGGCLKEDPARIILTLDSAMGSWKSPRSLMSVSIRSPRFLTPIGGRGSETIRPSLPPPPTPSHNTGFHTLVPWIIGGPRAGEKKRIGPTRSLLHSST